MKFSEINDRGWDDKPLVIVGTGASLKGFDFGRLDRPDVRVLAVKEAVADCPFAAECVSIHFPWVAARLAFLNALSVPLTFGAEAWPEIPRGFRTDVTFVNARRAPGLSRDRSTIHYGATSGDAALNVATLRGARRILLMGFDYGTSAGRHYNDAAYPHYKARHDAHWQRWAGWFESPDLAADLTALRVQVFNANPDSAVRAFPFTTIEAFAAVQGR